MTDDILMVVKTHNVLLLLFRLLHPVGIREAVFPICARYDWQGVSKGAGQGWQKYWRGVALESTMLANICATTYPAYPVTEHVELFRCMNVFPEKRDKKKRLIRRTTSHVIRTQIR